MTEETSSFLRICQEGHANALSLNKECTSIVVAGRSLLKVFSIEPDGFNEICNMRGGKNQNLSYSSNDVAWSSLDNNILATAATNGIISVWDLSKFGRHKQTLIFNEHSRTAHTIAFHSTDPHLLISGSQDGTIKCFDLRVEKFAVNTYCSNSESVRDLKFCPYSPNNFAAVSETGQVQLWDIRRNDKAILQFTAHSGPIYTCDWHGSQHWLATGSRDKQIKVWNMGVKPSLEYTIHTIAVVGRVKWRPEMTHHIASCALVMDYSIVIWDVRRPFIPFASFDEHTNVTTGIAWKGNDPNILLSTSKDSTIYKHVFKDASHPAVKANPQGSTMNFKGDLLFSYKVKVTTPPVATATTSSKNCFMGSKQKQSPTNEPFHLAKSKIQAYTPKPSPNLFNDFVSLCAKEYCLNGNSLSSLCDHNANVAKKYGKHDIGLIWNFVKKLYSSSRVSNSDQESVNPNLLSNRMSQNSNQQNSGWDEKNGIKDDEFQTNDDDTKHFEFKSGEYKNSANSLFPSNSKYITDSESDVVFGDASLDDYNVERVRDLRNGFLSLANNYNGTNNCLSKGWSLPNTLLGHDLQASRQQEVVPEHEISPPPPPSVLKITTMPSLPIWDPNQILADCLILQTDLGDVQTAISVLLVLGDRRNELPIDELVHESWLLAYIDMLQRLQLWNEATEIMKLSWVQSVRELNDLSTIVHTNCGGCNKAFLGTSGWYCNKCNSTESAKCSVCQLVVRGLYAWCQGCGHGGHLEHMKQWFLNHSKCASCGHLCEYE